MVYCLDNLYKIPIGRAGENLARTVRVDVKPYLDMWPSGKIEMIVQRPGEESFYPVDIKIDDGILYWTVTASDTAIPGTGKMEIRVTDGEVLAKSVPGSFVVGKSMSGTETDPPDPAKGWADSVLDAATRAENAAKKAEDIAGGMTPGEGITEETDPTVPAWAKQPNKPEYTAEEVGARPSDWLPTAEEIGAQQKGDYALKSEIPEMPEVPTKLSQLAQDSENRTVTDAEKSAWDAKSDFSGSYNDLKDTPTLPTVPTNVSAFINDAGYLTEHQDISGKLDADKLPEAVNDALAQAKASGEFDGEDGTSVTVSSVSESTDDGGSNVVTFSDGKTLTVKNGSKGKDAPQESILHTAQTLTDAQKAQARANIGAQANVDALPDYWLTHLNAKIPSINTAMESAGRNRSAFYFYTDAHRISSANMTPSLLRYLYKYTSVQRTNNGGDFFEPFATGADNLALMRNYMADTRGLPNHHSVIGNHDEDNEALTSDQQMYGFYFAWEENKDVVWGGYHFYYIDNKTESTRYLYLDTGKFAVSDAEMLFVIDALATLPDDWHVVAISHIWYDYNISALPDYVLHVLSVFDAYNARSAGSITHNGVAFAYDFTESLGTVEFCVGGHVHADQVYYSTGGIPVIITDTDSTVRKGDAATIGTITESCIDAVVADYDARILNLIRIGRGSDRTITLPTYGTSVPSEAINILNVYDIQYNKRYSPTSNGYKDANGVIAFAVPWDDVWGKTVFFKGFALMWAASGSGSDWYIFKEGVEYTGEIMTTDVNMLYNIFYASALQKSNDVYNITLNESALKEPTTFADADRLQIQMVLNSTDTAVSAADLANCIMTIDQPIE